MPATDHAKLPIGIIGSGDVGRILAEAFLTEGHAITLGTRDPGKTAIAQWAQAHPGAQVGDFAQTAAFGEIVVLAVQGSAAENALELANAAGQLEGKIIIDTTNPISNEPPTDGVLSFFTGPNDSLLERLQAKFPGARLVKAFNSVGASLMYQPQFPSGPKPTMFICGNDAEAKRQVSEILEAFGWTAADFGKATVARAIEPLCQLWCTRVFNEGRVNHAFCLLER